MPTPPFDFGVQNNFPMAAVIDAAQRNNALQEQAREAGNKSLIAGLQSIGKVGETIVDRRMAMAQALAMAKWAQANGLLGNNAIVPAGPQSQTDQDYAAGPVDMNQLPGQAGTAPAGPQAPIAPQGIDLNTAATAFMGASPKDLLDALGKKYQVQEEARGHDIEAERNAAQANYQDKMISLELEKNRIEDAFKRGELSNQEAKSKIDEINQTTKDLLEANKQSGIFTVAGRTARKVSKGLQQRLNALQEPDNNSINFRGTPAVGKTVTHPSGVKITRVK